MRLKRAIRQYSVTVAMILGFVVMAAVTAGYIIHHEGVRLPFLDPTPFQIQADLAEAKAITPGQGQTVRVSGVQIGDIAGVRLSDGHAVVTMTIEPRFRNLIHTDATALVRPKTFLDDMFVELNPGSDRAPLIHPGYTIPLSDTLPYVDTDQVLASLDGDTRDYLQLLLGGAAQGLQGNGINVREIFRRLGPTHRDLARFTQAVATRRANLRELIHSLHLLNAQLAQRSPEITRLVNASSVSLHALASQQQNLALTIHDLPAGLAQATTTLNRVRAYANLLGPTATRLEPVVGHLNASNYAVRPLAVQATPIIRGQIRPFVTASRPLVRDLRPTSRSLATATPSLTQSFGVLNHLFNMVAFNQDGRQPPSVRNRDEGFLYWIAWVDHASLNLFSTEDANGNFRPLTLGGTCQTLKSLVSTQPAAEFLLNLTPVLTSSQACGMATSQLPVLSPSAAGILSRPRARRGR